MVRWLLSSDAIGPMSSRAAALPEASEDSADVGAIGLTLEPLARQISPHTLDAQSAATLPEGV